MSLMGHHIAVRKRNRLLKIFCQNKVPENWDVYNNTPVKNANMLQLLSFSPSSKFSMNIEHWNCYFLVGK
jgi:hypothetical protein